MNNVKINNGNLQKQKSFYRYVLSLGALLLSVPSSPILAGTNSVKPKLQFKAEVKQSKFLLGEPIVFNVMLESSQKALLPLFPQYIHASVTLPGGKKQNSFTGFYEGRGQYSFTEINPNNTWRKNFNLVNMVPIIGVGKYSFNVSYDSTWYTNNNPADVYQGVISSNQIEIELIEPKGENADVFQLIKKAAGQQDYGPFSQIFRDSENNPVLERIVKDYPKSAYAKYAAFYLGEYYRELAPRYGEPKDRQQRIDQALLYYSKALKDYPAFQLTGQAQLGIAGSYFVVRDYASSEREAKKVLTDYPNSAIAQQAEKLIKDISGQKQNPLAQ